jgi:hypothetical protein
MWPSGHGETGSIRRQSSRSSLARLRPFGLGGPVGRPPGGEATFPGRWSGWASSWWGGHLPGPMRPRGHGEPDPRAGNDASALVRCVREDAQNLTLDTAVRCGDRDPLHHDTRYGGPALLAPAKAFWRIGTGAACKRCAGPGPIVTCWPSGSGRRPPAREATFRAVWPPGHDGPGPLRSEF